MAREFYTAVMLLYDEAYRSHLFVAYDSKPINFGQNENCYFLKNAVDRFACLGYLRYTTKVKMSIDGNVPRYIGE